MLLCGALGGAAYDAMMLLRHALHAGRVATGLLDLCLGAMLAVGVTCAGLYLEMDPFRLYAFAGVGLGLLAWYAAAGQLLRRMMALAGRIVQKKAK